MESNYLVSLSTFMPFGPARIKLLIDYFGSPGNAWFADGRRLAETGIKSSLVSEFLRYRNNFDQRNYFNNLRKIKIGFVTIFDRNYPKNLQGIDFAPLVLYFKGELKNQDANSIAIVGSRKMTPYGKEIAETFARDLAMSGLTIVSGLARGIDTIAHKSALLVKGRTIAVLGCGLDIIYPPENKYLADLIEKNGALVSEFPLGYPVKPSNFAARNRIISGLSRSVVVVEGENKSGTLLTASHAAQQGRDVFAVPGSIKSPMSYASHFLIQNGARIATCAEDILDELNLCHKQ